LDDQEKQLLDICRQLRNDFAHGDWSQVRSALHTIPFSSALNLMSAIFTKIENGMPSKTASA
jgi:magnesium-transporting ATPase (P-type)